MLASISLTDFLHGPSLAIIPSAFTASVTWLEDPFPRESFGSHRFAEWFAVASTTKYFRGQWTPFIEISWQCYYRFLLTKLKWHALAEKVYSGILRISLWISDYLEIADKQITNWKKLPLFRESNGTISWQLLESYNLPSKNLAFNTSIL